MVFVLGSPALPARTVMDIGRVTSLEWQTTGGQWSAVVRGMSCQLAAPRRREPGLSRLHRRRLGWLQRPRRAADQPDVATPAAGTSRGAGSAARPLTFCMRVSWRPASEVPYSIHGAATSHLRRPATVRHTTCARALSVKCVFYIYRPPLSDGGGFLVRADVLNNVPFFGRAWSQGPRVRPV